MGLTWVHGGQNGYYSTNKDVVDLPRMCAMWTSQSGSVCYSGILQTLLAQDKDGIKMDTVIGLQRYDMGMNWFQGHDGLVAGWEYHGGQMYKMETMHSQCVNGGFNEISMIEQYGQ